jgi:integrase
MAAPEVCGTGMRLMEGLPLRIKDVDFDRHMIIVREAKGSKAVYKHRMRWSKNILG